MIDLKDSREKTLQICPEEITVLENTEFISFLESLQTEFLKLKIKKNFTACGLYCGIEFCYRHPLVFWTRTGLDYSKRMNDQLYADFYLQEKTLHFKAASPNDEKEKAKSWPVEMLVTEPTVLMTAVLDCFRKFYKKYHSNLKQNW